MIIGVTGHRLQKLPCKFDRFHPWKLEKLKILERHLTEASPHVIVSGMALGFDTWMAWLALKLNIPLHCYLPCDKQEKMWSLDHQKQYHGILEKATVIKNISPGGYAAWKMLKRDDEIVKDSEMMLSLWNPEFKSGGTWHTVAMAVSLNKPVINFWGNNPMEINNACNISYR